MKQVFEVANAPRRPRERGSAFLMALFLALVMLAISVVALQQGATLSRRDREAEMIWRGDQYKRAIRLYFHKTGHYPQTIDDLRKGLPQLHFLRQAYKDPMNKDDGAWRFIYVNAAGQIIGSTRYASLQQMALLESGQLLPGQQAAVPGQPGIPVSSLTDSGSGAGTQTGQGPAPGSAGGNVPGAGQNPAPDQPGQNPPSQPPDQSGQNPRGSQSPAQPGPTGQSPFGQPGQLGLQSGTSGTFGNPAALQKPTGPVDGPVLGGFLTGVASKVDRPSLKVYHGGKKYLEWEFIWNPLADAASAAQQALGPQGGLPGMPGLPIANPFGGGTTMGPGLPGQNPQPPPQPPPSQP